APSFKPAVDLVEVVAYLSDDDEYNKTWMSHRRDFWGILGFNRRSAAGLAQIARHLSGQLAKPQTQTPRAAITLSGKVAEAGGIRVALAFSGWNSEDLCRRWIRGNFERAELG